MVFFASSTNTYPTIGLNTLFVFTNRETSIHSWNWTKVLNPDILELLKMPKKIKQNAIEIEKMEKGLHKVIKGRVEKLIKDNGQALPQLALLFEKGSFYQPIPTNCHSFQIRLCRRAF
jgi:hypothetical protein